MPKIMTLPKIGVNMTEAVISKWLVEVGSEVKDGDAILEAETDKSTQEIYATCDGIVAELLAAEGDTVECNADLIVFVEKGEKYEAGSAAKKAEVELEKKEEVKAEPEKKEETPLPVKATKAGRVRISPLAKKIAKEKGYDLAELAAAFPDKRIVKADVEKFESVRPVSCGKTFLPEGGDYEVIPMSMMRKTIAAGMKDSAMNKPRVALTATINAAAIMSLRAAYKAKGIKVSMDSIIARIAAAALLEHRNLNSRFEDGAIHCKNDVNIGVAVDTPKGLLVPVIKHADRKRLTDVAEEMTGLVELARNFRLSPDDMSGATFTITNLGVFGVEEFDPIVNAPECAILGIGTLKKEFVPDENDQPKLVTNFKVTLSFDHCMVDGAPAARFLKTFKEYAENPMMIL